MLFIYCFSDGSFQPRIYTAAIRNRSYHACCTNSDVKSNIPIPCCTTPIVVEQDALTPPRSGSSTSSIELGASMGGVNKRDVSLGYQLMKNIPESLIERKSSTNLNCKEHPTVPDTQIANAANRLSSCDRNIENKNNKMEQPIVRKLSSLCQVCGDKAPEHIHYGSVSCFSCRAFFRRSVAKSHTYLCPGNKRCSILVTTRKNCQYCRYHTCLRAGMRPTWVLTDKEKKERMKNKRQSKGLLKSHVEGSKYFSADIDMDAGFIQNSSNQALINFPGFTNEDDQYLEELISAQHATVYNEVLGKQVAHAIAKCIQTDVQEIESLVLPRWATLEFFRVQYSRIAKFTMLVEDFSTLTTKSQRILLHHNLEAITIIRLGIYFKSTTGRFKDTVDLLDREIISFGSQLREMGLEGKMADELGAYTAEPPPPLTIEQIFTKDWATDSQHLTLYHKVMGTLNNLIGIDAKLVLIFQMVNLFNTNNAGAELEHKERKTIEATQEKWTVLLAGYIRMKFGRFKALMILPKLMLIIYELRLLSEKNSW